MENGNPFDANDQQNDRTNPFDVSYQSTQGDSQSIPQVNEQPSQQDDDEEYAQHVHMFNDYPEEAQQLDHQIQTDLATPCPSTIEVDGQVFENVKVRDVSLDLPQSEETPAPQSEEVPVSQPIETPIPQAEQDDDDAQHVHMFDDHPEEAQQLDHQIQTDLATPCPSTIEVDGHVYENVKVKDVSLDLPQSEETPISQPIETPISQPIETPISQPIETPISQPIETPISQPIETLVSQPISQVEQDDDAQHVHTFEDHPEVAKQIDESIQKDLATPCPSTIEIDGQVFENVRVKDIELNDSTPSIPKSSVEEVRNEYEILNDTNIRQAKDAQKKQEQNEEEKRKQRELERQKQLEEIRKRQQEYNRTPVNNDEEKRKQREIERQKQLEAFRNQRNVGPDAKQAELIEEEKRKKRELERQKQLEEFRKSQQAFSS